MFIRPFFATILALTCASAFAQSEEPADTVALNEVIVEGRSVIHSKGNLIVTPSADDRKASATSLSLIEKLPLPGLQANPLSRTLTVDGGTPMILINGIPSSINDVNMLQPKDIAKIEYSRTTPERYIDKGVTGLISITLKKRNDGGSLYFYGRSAVTTAFMDYNLSAKYHQGPSQFTLFYYPSWRNNTRTYDNTTEAYIGDDFRVDLEEHDHNPFNYNFHQVQLRYDYSPNMATLFAATFNMMPNFYSGHVAGTVDDSFSGSYEQSSFNRSTDYRPSLDLFLHRDFNQTNSLELEVVGTMSHYDYRRDNRYIYTDGNVQNYTMDADSRRYSLISEANYIHKFGDAVSLSAGYQNTISRSTNKYLETNYKPVLTENNNYLYARLGWQLSKVFISASTGAKMFWVRNDQNHRHFIRNISTLRANWNLNQQWSFGAIFQYTPSIPSLTSLTDYPQQITPYLISNGNPDLKVAENFMYRLSSTFQSPKATVSLYVTYNDLHNAMISDVTYMGDHKFLQRTVNAATGRQLFTNLQVKVGSFAGFGANGSLGFDYNYFSFAGWTHHLTSLYGTLSVWWNKGPFTLQYYRVFPSKNLWGYSESKAENLDMLAAQYQPNQHWAFGLEWMCPFSSKGLKYPSISYSPVNPSTRERYIKNQANMLSVTVVYTTDFGSIFRSASRSLNNSDNASSLMQ